MNAGSKFFSAYPAPWHLSKPIAVIFHVFYLMHTEFFNNSFSLPVTCAPVCESLPTCCAKGWGKKVSFMSAQRQERNILRRRREREKKINNKRCVTARVRRESYFRWEKGGCEDKSHKNIRTRAAYSRIIYLFSMR